MRGLDLAAAAVTEAGAVLALVRAPTGRERPRHPPHPPTTVRTRYKYPVAYVILPRLVVFDPLASSQLRAWLHTLGLCLVFFDVGQLVASPLGVRWLDKVYSCDDQLPF